MDYSNTALYFSSLHPAGFEFSHHLLHCDPLYPIMRIDVLNNVLMHQDHVWFAADLRVYGHREEKTRRIHDKNSQTVSSTASQ